VSLALSGEPVENAVNVTLSRAKVLDFASAFEGVEHFHHLRCPQHSRTTMQCRVAAIFCPRGHSQFSPSRIRDSKKLLTDCTETNLLPLSAPLRRSETLLIAPSAISK
jgi:hypothetical protein